MVDFDQTLIALFAATRWHEGASVANGAPNTGANTGGAGTCPCSATPEVIEPSGPVGNARASHCIHPHLPRRGNAPHQLNQVMSENGSEGTSASRINSATAYSNVKRDFSAMPAGSYGDHSPMSVELDAIAGRMEQMIATASDRAKAHIRLPIHESPHRCVCTGS